jgi:hypothetical protein
MKFIRALPKARLELRSLVHTLKFSSIKKSDYDLEMTSWLADVLNLLPNLQSFIAQGLPSLDHRSLQILTNRARHKSLRGQVTSFNVRLMDASQCQNVTPQGLIDVIPLFANVLYLSLSYTPSVRDGHVLDALRNLQGLQILKLRGVGLRDDDVARLAKAIKLRVRSLDVRDNRITDEGAKALLRECLLTDDSDHGRSARPNMADPLDNEDFESYILHTFTTKFADRLWIEDTPAQGLTHLYISGNSLTAGCVNEIARTGRLHVLDVGNLTKDYPAEPLYRSEPASQSPGLEHLPSTLLKHAAATLTLLRIDHILISVIVNSDLRSSFNPLNLRTLIFTGVPSSSTTADVANAIIEFIVICAAEAQRAWAQALDDYALPPGRRSDNAAVTHAAEQRFALRRIVLEIASMRDFDDFTARNLDAHDGRTTLSMTEDRDSEAFWAASDADFSFFGDENSASSRPSPRTSSLARSKATTAPQFDTVNMVAAFRRDRGLAFRRQRASSPGCDSPVVEGHWKGVVQIVRNAEVHSYESNDYLGSRFR